MSRGLDKIDHKILRILQEKGRITNLQLSQEISLSPAPTLERVRKLEKESYIESYHAKVNHKKLGLNIRAFIQVTLVRQRENAIARFVEQIRAIDEIVECEQVTGDFDYQLKVVAQDISAFDHLITDKLSTVEEIGHMKSYIILSTIKSSNIAPVTASNEH